MLIYFAWRSEWTDACRLDTPGRNCRHRSHGAVEASIAFLMEDRWAKEAGMEETKLEKLARLSGKATSLRSAEFPVAIRRSQNRTSERVPLGVLHARP
jgi:pseudouridine-5'-phosphate glycosidase